MRKPARVALSGFTASKTVAVGFLALGATAFAAPLNGCSSKSSTPDTSAAVDTAAVADVDNAFEANLVAVQQAFDACVAAGKCKPFAAEVTSNVAGSVSAQSLGITHLLDMTTDGGDDDADADGGGSPGTGDDDDDSGASGGSSGGIVSGTDGGGSLIGDAGPLIGACGTSLIGTVSTATDCCVCAAVGSSGDDDDDAGASGGGLVSSQSLAHPQSIHPLDTGTCTLSRPSLCRALRPLIGRPHAYFAVGGNITAAFAVAVTGGGEAVWDLWNQQEAVFLYGGGGGSTNASISANGYFSFAFYNGAGVLPAWSGQFISFTLDVGTPVAHLGVGVTGFGNSDLSMKGGSLALSVGLSVLPVDIATFLTYAVANDTLTQGAYEVANLSYADEHDIASANDGIGHHRNYIQYTTGRAMGASIATTLGTLGGAVAAPLISAALPMIVYGTAIGTLKERHFDYEKNCPH